jgi:undecaprenol kinase
MLIDTCRDERMRDLHQKRCGASEEEEALAIDPAGNAVDREDSGVAHFSSVAVVPAGESGTPLLPRPQTTRVLLRSFGYAFEGVGYILRTQRNARIEVAIAIGALILAAWLGFGAVEWAVLVLTIVIVVALEWINTALELAVSLASPDAHPSAKAAKDVAAACVLLGAIASLVIGLLLFGSRLVSRLLGT